MMTKKTFFKGLATILLLPGGFILAAVLAILFAVLLAVSIYVVIFVALFDWIISRVRALTLSFRKAHAPKRRVAPPAIPRADDLPENQEHRLKPVPQGKWLQ